MRLIGVNTKLVGLLGNPLGQSLAPFTQNRVYQALGLDYFYFPIELADKEGLAPVVAGIRHMNFAGFAVTKPYKVTILPFLDAVEETAAQMGSCNTVVCKNGTLTGHNTDGIGAITALQREGVAIEGGRFVSFGAGGTGRSVCFELARHGAKAITISSRSEKCEALAGSVNRYFPGVCTAVRAADTAPLKAAVESAGVLLNLSGLGMAATLEETPVPAGWLGGRPLCFDATYNPAETRFLRDAKAAGCPTVNGFGMMAFQGARQVALWAGVPEPNEEMLRFAAEAAGQNREVK